MTKEQYITRTGKNHFRWKGDNAGYVSKHEWVYRHFGKANRCEECGCEEIPEGKKRWFHWSNISGEYKRDKKDWEQLCIPCHREKDGWRDKIQDKFLKSKCWEKRLRDEEGNFI